MTTRHRRATRALILDPQEKFLLFLSHFDPGSGLDPRWVFPGGGLEDGEAPIEGILREILEETGRSYPAEQLIELNHPFSTRWKIHGNTTAAKPIFSNYMFPRHLNQAKSFGPPTNTATQSSIAGGRWQRSWLNNHGLARMVQLTSYSRGSVSHPSSPTHSKLPNADNKHYVN